MTRVPLDELIISDESGFACSKSKLVEVGLTHLRPFNISDAGNLELSALYQVPLDVAPRGKSSLEEGDILFNNTNSADLVGKSALIGLPMVAGFSNHMTRIRVNKERIEPAFLAYWLRRLRSTGHFTAHATQWVSQAAYKSSELRKLAIELPPIPDQRRIVDLLSRAEGIVRLRREAEKKAAELIPALFLDMFGDPATNPKWWPVPVLGELLKDGPQNGLYKHGSHYGEGTPILRIDAFYDGQVRDLKALKRVTLNPDECARFRLRPRDLIINRVNSPEYLGKSTIIPALDEETVFESNMMRLSVDEARVLPEYVIELLQTAHAKAHFLSKAKHAINQSSINQQDVKSLGVPIPPLLMQHDFVEKVGQVRSIQSQQSAATAKAKATFDALLAQVFSEQ
jgi:type I restriction enzyme S subunit